MSTLLWSYVTAVGMKIDQRDSTAALGLLLEQLSRRVQGADIVKMVAFVRPFQYGIVFGNGNLVKF